MHKYPVAYSVKFSTWILNEVALNLVLIYGDIFSSDCRPSYAETAPRFITIISSAEARTPRRSVSDIITIQAAA